MKFKRSLLVLTAIGLFIFHLNLSEIYSQIPVQKYFKIKIFLDKNFTFQNALKFGLDFEGAITKKDNWIITIADENELSGLIRLGVKFEVIQSDLARFYNERLKENAKSDDIQQAPVNFKLGSKGGYYKLKEVYAQFDSMKARFPQYLKKTEIIGKSFESRPIYAYCFGDSGGSKPEVLFTALHHAREPGGASCLIYFLWDFLEKADKGDTANNYLLNNRSIFIIPVVNPDGYYYNELTFPTGGGFWRKNRRWFNDSTYGVDLNRNYGPVEFWNAPVDGSSVDSSSPTYRGKSPFSEPETQALRDFVTSHNFRTALNYHTYGNKMIYPYGSLDSETPDSMLFRDLTTFLTRKNLYYQGRDPEILYPTRGSSDDFMYLDGVSRGKTIVMTPEVGNAADGFWPLQSRIVPIALENLDMNYQYAWSAAVNLRPVKFEAKYNQVNNVCSFNLMVENLGIEVSAASTLLNVLSLDLKCKILNPTRFLNSLKSAQKQVEIFNILITDKTFINGSEVPVEVLINQDGVPRRDTFKIQLYNYTNVTLFADDSLHGKWDMGDWGTELDPVLNKKVLSDSPGKMYRDSTKNYLTMTVPIHIDTFRTTLEFQTRWETESDYDCCVIQISTDNGFNWEYLKTSRMVDGLGITGRLMIKGLSGFSGKFRYWIHQECPLDNYRGKNVLLRFGLLSDQGGNFDGWHLDNVKLRVYDKPRYEYAAQENSKPGFSIFPNPVKIGELINLITGNSDNAEKCNIKVLNLPGSIVYETYILLSGDNDVMSLPTGNLSPGVYFIQIQAGREVKTGRCVILP